MKRKLVLGAALGNCVHVAGVAHFLQLAEREGWDTLFLGPAVPVSRLFEDIKKYRPDMVAVSYRLTPENAVPILDELESKRSLLDYSPVWVFGGTPKVAKIAKRRRMFSYVSDGKDDLDDSIRFLRGETAGKTAESRNQNLIDRIKNSSPYPILRHHFGLPSLEDTIKGVEKIAKARVLDVISLGPDQNAQQFFFRPDKMKREFDGAGGVPIRTKDDLKRLKAASQCGNFPLMRCYSGTEDVFKYAPMLLETIDNAWAAIPLCWYNELDGRGDRPVEVSIAEAQKLIAWHAQRGVPVELNEAHHWSLRDAHDTMTVAMAYIAAYNAKKMGVKHYVAQYMFNNPTGLSFPMDLARVLAMTELVESLEGDGFNVYRQTRAGLPLFNADMDVAKGQLAATTFLQMAVKPDIIHVVSYSEADHAASAGDVIASCKIVRGVIRHTLGESFSMEKDEAISARKEELISEVRVLLDFIKNRFSKFDDPLANPYVLSECIKRGYLDAVHIVKNGKFRGNLATKFVGGKCLACDRETGELLDEARRLGGLIAREEPYKAIG
ncbi:MAG: cobalamin B12-binding domain-containing protein [Oscillospiraceae bacterium]|jgi:hypothetical protein